MGGTPCPRKNRVTVQYYFIYTFIPLSAYALRNAYAICSNSVTCQNIHTQSLFIIGTLQRKLCVIS